RGSHRAYIVLGSPRVRFRTRPQAVAHESLLHSFPQAAQRRPDGSAGEALAAGTHGERVDPRPLGPGPGPGAAARPVRPQVAHAARDHDLTTLQTLLRVERPTDP